MMPCPRPRTLIGGHDLSARIDDAVEQRHVVRQELGQVHVHDRPQHLHRAIVDSSPRPRRVRNPQRLLAGFIAERYLVVGRVGAPQGRFQAILLVFGQLTWPRLPGELPGTSQLKCFP